MFASELVAAVRQQASATAQAADADILSVADRQIQGRLLPLLRSLNQDFGAREVELPIGVGGRVLLPRRAVAGGLLGVQVAVGSNWVQLPNLDMSRDLWAGVGQGSLSASGSAGGPTPQGYRLDAGGLVMVPRASSGTVRIRYMARPGKLVLETDASKVRVISGVSDSGGNWILTTTGWTGGASGTIDVVSLGPTHHHVLIDCTYSFSAPTMTVAKVGAAGPGSGSYEVPSVLDYVVQSDYSPFVPLPEELSAALVHRTAAEILHSMGYLEEAGSQREVAEECIQEARLFLQPRNNGNPMRRAGGIRGVLQRNNWGW